jgi:thioredoxin-related protein
MLTPHLKAFGSLHPDIPIEDVDADTPAGEKLQQEYSLMALPTVLFLDEKGRRLASMVGMPDGKPATVLEAKLREARKKDAANRGVTVGAAGAVGATPALGKKKPAKKKRIHRHKAAFVATRRPAR